MGDTQSRPPRPNPSSSFYERRTNPGSGKQQQRQPLKFFTRTADASSTTGQWTMMRNQTAVLPISSLYPRPLSSSSSSSSSPTLVKGEGDVWGALRAAAADIAAAAAAAHSNRTTTMITRCDNSSSSSSTTTTDALPPPPPLPPGSKAPVPPPPPPPTTGDGTATAAAADSIEAASRSMSYFANPGPYEQAMSDGKRLVQLDTFDGFRCDINKQVSPFMAAIHNFHLGTTMMPDNRKSSYTFLAQVADEQGMIMARLDPARGSLDGRIHKALFGGMAMGKLQMSVSSGSGNDSPETGNNNDSCMAELDFGGQTWTGNLKYGSMGGGLVYGMNYMQTLHRNVAAGGEGLYIANNQNTIGSYGMKFNWVASPSSAASSSSSSSSSSSLLGGGDSNSVDAPPPPTPPGMPPSEAAGSSVLCLNYNSNQMAMTVNYKRCVTPNRLTLGAELQFSPFSLESQLLMGAEYKWQRSKMNLCVDGAGRIQSILEAKYGMAPGSPSLLLAAEMDHANDTMKFGYGINIES